MTDVEALFKPVQLGDLRLPNRIVMAPMTRLRAPDWMPTPAMVDYYRQRASAGLIVTECTAVSDTSSPYLGAPGIYHDRFIAGWRAVTEAVHEAGGRIFLQLWHAGRVGHVDLQPGNAPPLAPSEVPGVGQLHGPQGPLPYSTPRALKPDEVLGLVRAFGKAAGRARAAGFDGVELHAAFGYLIDQFLQDGSNRRTDEFGGSLANRTRFLMNVVAAAQQEFGRAVGVKLSPGNRANGMSDSDPRRTFAFVLEALDEVDLAYVHVMEPTPDDLAAGCAVPDALGFAREHFRGVLISNGGHSPATAAAAVGERGADLVSFGRAFIANPDLPERIRRGLPLQAPDQRTIYRVPGAPLERGYSDYPALACEVSR